MKRNKFCRGGRCISVRAVRLALFGTAAVCSIFYLLNSPVPQRAASAAFRNPVLRQYRIIPAHIARCQLVNKASFDKLLQVFEKQGLSKIYLFNAKDAPDRHTLLSRCLPFRNLFTRWFVCGLFCLMYAFPIALRWFPSSHFFSIFPVPRVIFPTFCTMFTN